MSQQIDISDFILFNQNLRSNKADQWRSEKKRAFAELEHLRTILHPLDRLMIDAEWNYQDFFTRGCVRLTRGAWIKRYRKHQ